LTTAIGAIVPEKPGRTLVLISSACAIFWSSAFIFGLIFTACGFLSGPLGPWLSGYILDPTQGNYTLVFSYLGLMYLASTGLILLVRPWRECQL
jgi:OFA family oxalate/formate antiporter-like MFS transporter